MALPTYLAIPTDNLEVLFATLVGEAEGEPIEGKQAVASVILNRNSHQPPSREFASGQSIADTCLVPWQFSCWRDPNCALRMNAAITQLRDDPTKLQAAQADCLAIAHAALDGSLTDNTNHSLFYKTTLLPWPQAWGPQVPPQAVIGHQSFYILANP